MTTPPPPYQSSRNLVYTEDGVKQLLRVFATALQLIGQSGSVMNHKLMGAGDSWTQLNCVDVLEEVGFLHCLNPDAAGQDRVYVAGKNLPGGLL